MKVIAIIILISFIIGCLPESDKQPLYYDECLDGETWYPCHNIPLNSDTIED